MIYERITRHLGYAASQRCRKRIGEAFGWMQRRRGTHAIGPGLPLNRKGCQAKPRGRSEAIAEVGTTATARPSVTVLEIVGNRFYG
jgi:hypothetical protein